MWSRGAYQRTRDGQLLSAGRMHAARGQLQADRLAPGRRPRERCLKQIAPQRTRARPPRPGNADTERHRKTPAKFVRSRFHFPPAPPCLLPQFRANDLQGALVSRRLRRPRVIWRLWNFDTGVVTRGLFILEPTSVDFGGRESFSFWTLQFWLSCSGGSKNSHHDTTVFLPFGIFSLLKFLSTDLEILSLSLSLSLSKRSRNSLERS